MFQGGMNVAKCQQSKKNIAIEKCNLCFWNFPFTMKLLFYIKGRKK